MTTEEINNWKKLDDLAKNIVTESYRKIEQTLTPEIIGKFLYQVRNDKHVFKGQITGCKVKCYKEYLMYNSVAIDIITSRKGQELWTATYVHDLHIGKTNCGYLIVDTLVNEEEK